MKIHLGCILIDKLTTDSIKKNHKIAPAICINEKLFKKYVLFHYKIIMCTNFG